MKIILKKLTLRNFKGVVSKEIDFEDRATNIFGANESGKSTIYTAFNWLLTGKDEFERKDFEIKNTSKKELNKQSHEVEATIYTLEDGLIFEHKLKRAYLEKWVRERGQPADTFKGHTTEFWWNDVPCNQSEFQAKVDSIMDGKILKMITNPHYFTSLKWDDQRRGLIAIAGNITHNDISEKIATPENDFGALINALNSGKKVDEYKAELSAKKSLLKKKALEYAPRIDEAQRSLPEVLDWNAIQEQIQSTETEIQGIETTLSNASKALAEKQKGVLEIQKQKHTKESELENLKQSIRIELNHKYGSRKSEIESAERLVKLLKADIERFHQNEKDEAEIKEHNLSRIAEINENVSLLRKEWDAINSEVFSFDETTCTCPTCKQSLPAHDIELKKEELRTNFNKDISERKLDRVNRSELYKKEIAQLTKRIEQESNIPQLLTEKETELAAATNKLSELIVFEGEDINVEEEIAKSIKGSKAVKALSDDIEKLKLEIETATANIQSGDHSELKSKKLQLSIELDDLKNKFAVKKTIEKTEQRIEQLKKEESENAHEIANIEKQEFEIDQYNKAHMSILEERVNDMFQFVKWNLFEAQVNGSVVETCVCTYNGVPYHTLNTAGKLIAGIDILNTLSQYYDVYAPVFCDNRESVTEIPVTKSQIINLYVSPSDKNIRVEYK